MKVCTFTTRLMQLNKYLLYFPPDCVGQIVTAQPDDEVKEILYHAMPNLWRKKMTKQGYNYLERYIQEISDSFEIRVLIQKKLKKAFKERKKRKQELRTSEKMEVSGSEESNQSLDDSNASSKIIDIK